MMHRPDFGIVCTHGGDSGGPFDEVCLLRWFPQLPGWATTVADEAGIKMSLMTEEEHGWDPAFLTEEPDPRRRIAVEIPCLNEHCRTLAYRATDDATLQTLLTRIATDVDPCRVCGNPFAVTRSFTDDMIMMTLQQLHWTAGHARAHYGLHV
jgi:hypothetical protein